MKKTSLSQHVVSAGLVVYTPAKAAVRFFGLLPPSLRAQCCHERTLLHLAETNLVFEYLPLYQAWVQLSNCVLDSSDQVTNILFLFTLLHLVQTNLVLKYLLLCQTWSQLSYKAT